MPYSGGHTSYQPALNRDRSFTARPSSPETTPLADSAGGPTQQTNGPRRNKSLIRPERERVNSTHRQYHYRQAAEKRGTDGVAPSATGNQPTARPLERRPTRNKSILRRGKSILGRKERDDESDDEEIEPSPAINEGWFASLPGPWMIYCHAITCCVPRQLLDVMGVPKGPAQLAWREKIGLVSCILMIMGFVGFLTFGFTQAVCPIPPFTVHGGQVGNGYLIINGWAYMLADWSGHPAIPGVTNASTNLLYSPVNAGGMDATFLFQQQQPACQNVLTALQGNQPVYFPCELFNPNNTVAPPSSEFSTTNTTNCHLSSQAQSTYKDFYNNGVRGTNGQLNKAARVYYDWEDVNATNHLMIYNGNVLNLQLLQSLPTAYFRAPANGLIQAVLANSSAFGGMDMTMMIKSSRQPGTNWQEEAECLSSIIRVGSLDTMSLGCMASEIVLYLSLVVILGVIIVKFVLAVIFGWFLSWKLGNFEKEGQTYKDRMRREKEIENWTQNMSASAPLPLTKRMTFLPQKSKFTQPEHGTKRFEGDRRQTGSWDRRQTGSWDRRQTGSWDRRQTNGWMSQSGSLNMSPGFANNRPPSSFLGPNTPTTPRFFGDTGSTRMSYTRASSISSVDIRSVDSSDFSSTEPKCPLELSKFVIPRPKADYAPFGFQLIHTICLVTCYSEGEDGIRTTLDSIATSDYPNSHKLLIVICDGIVTGHGNSMATPEVCVGMMKDFVIKPELVEAKPYMAIADGSKRNNMAKVYGGFYKYDNSTVAPEHQQRVPMVTIVKCGTPEEAGDAKPGNRGKRDSQMVLMQFLQKVMFNERMTTMEYEFFNAVWRVSGVSPDSYETCLMVDADTKLFPDALSRLISCAVKDPEVAGLCGETKIANKTDSWVSMIQVFEYYISHHQSKAFESIFGGVTCLPGCFCMYRIKSPKGPNGYWMPVLANPDIVQNYAENVVDTLHKKNLLLLGEDRYLSTLMLRTFPNRKMLFVPQAVCKTVVPDTFKVLLSQRRRWINSTIHNLMELLFVHDLCGTFCFSMQFVVFMELVGTLALPAAISFTLYLIIMALCGKPSVISLILLALILGLPAVLIVMTSRKVVYVGWMLVYLFSLPIWNFVLPTYAYWHFDDFSWGDTRKVEGSGKETGHGDKEGEFDSTQITEKTWIEHEIDRRTKEAIDAGKPVPRFLKPGDNIDIFRDSPPIKRPSTTASSDSDVPLTQHAEPPPHTSRNLRDEYSMSSYYPNDTQGLELNVMSREATPHPNAMTQSAHFGQHTSHHPTWNSPTPYPEHTYDDSEDSPLSPPQHHRF